jgi:P-type Ca2+ transporter type 2C
MGQQPRERGKGVLTLPDWMYLAGVGAVMMLGTLLVLDAYYPGGMITMFATGTAPNLADEAYARTMAFTTLMMFQLFNVYNCRSNMRSAFSGFFDNRWLLGAVVFSLLTHVAVVYVPFLQTAFHTVPIDPRDWLIAAGVAFVLLIVVELVKLVLRGQGGAVSAAPVRAPA